LELRCITPPKYVIRVLTRLENHGYSAYMVGGCVRDLVMNRHPNDWDVCTSALPEEVMSVFPRTYPTGIKHGTVTVVENGYTVEVTTYRADGDYIDHRHPESVQFIRDIKGDLERRDFTMNSLAFPLSGLIYDPFNGIDDIENKLIRCVGDPEKRFNEDALRMLRALRFSAVLGFEIEKNTLSSIKKNSALAASLARERISSELEKILLSNSPQVLSNLIGFGLLSGIVNKRIPEIDFTMLRTLPKNRSQRWAGFCSILLQNDLIDDAEKFMINLRLDSSVTQNVSAGVNLAFSKAPTDKTGWKKLISRNGTDIAKCAAAACEALYGRGYIRTLRSVSSSGECCSLKQLSVSGEDLLALGFRGPELGKTLFSLLDHVIVYPDENEKNILLGIAGNMKLG